MPRCGRRYDEPAPMVRRRVLLVGGDLVAALLRDYFQVCHSNDYEVVLIEYCDDALELVLHRPFDLVLLLSLRTPWRTWPILSSPARHMGSESAVLFLKQLRALHSQVPVIVASFRQDAGAETLRNGAFAFVLKPFDLAELDSLVALALAANGQPPLGE
jgi:DNA-binding NtrC family response regulator